MIKLKCVIVDLESLGCASPQEILSSSELIRYKSFGSQKRQWEFLLGRFAAKKALSHFVEVEYLKEISVDTVAAGYPIISNKLIARDYSVSISHSDNVATAVAFNKNFSCGIDIESINESKKNTMAKMSPEISSDDAEMLTVAWCAKEALGKALKTGLAIDRKMLEISDFSLVRDDDICDLHGYVNFKHFPEYKCIIKKVENKILALCVHICIKKNISTLQISKNNL